MSESVHPSDGGGQESENPMARYRHMPLPQPEAYSRLKAFLPEIQKDTEELERKIKAGEESITDLDIENIGDSSSYVEMVCYIYYLACISLLGCIIGDI